MAGFQMETGTIKIKGKKKAFSKSVISNIMIEEEEVKEVVGYVLSDSCTETFNFVVMEEKRVSKNQYVVVPHPHERNADGKPVMVLCRVLNGRYINPETEDGGYVTLLLSKTGMMFGGREQEILVFECQLLGYIHSSDSYSEFRPVSDPIPTLYPVFEVDEKFISKFFNFKQQQEDAGRLIVGKDAHANQDIFLEMNNLIKGHLLITGMTRSGKSTFALNLIFSGVTSNPPMRFIVYDRNNEYIGLKKLIPEDKIVIIDYRHFLDFRSLTDENLCSMLGLPLKLKWSQIITEAIFQLFEKRLKDPNRGSNCDECNKTKEGSCKAKIGWLCPKELLEIISTYRTPSSNSKEIARNHVRRARFQRRLKLLKFFDPKRENIIELIKKHLVVIVNLSTNNNIMLQQMAVAQIVKDVSRHALKTSGHDICCMHLLEEAQFYVAEKNAPSYGDNRGTNVYNTIASGLSQMGGYNVGFILITQRPAYVSKSAISQCNTVAVFRLRTKADHDQLENSSEYITSALKQTISSLRDNEFMLSGTASPLPFPVIVKANVFVRPMKATLAPTQVLQNLYKKEKDS